VIILDTDHFMILQVGRGPVYDVLSTRMDASPDQGFSTTVITFEEHMRGWLAEIRRVRDVADQVQPYDQLKSASFKRGKCSVSARTRRPDSALSDSSVFASVRRT
jgi:hypothetical protein